MVKIEIDEKDMDKYFDRLKVGECLDIKTHTKGFDDEVSIEISGSICRVDENTIKGKMTGPDKASFEIEIKKRRM